MAKLSVKGSRFRARVFGADGPEQARELRARARREHHDATHHVYAWRGLGDEARFDDDGEPSGTAGRPALGALRRAGLRRTGVVVVRWFGGTELGTGGLARAYGRVADRAVEEVPRRSAVPGRRVRVRHAYPDTGPVSSIVERSTAVRISAEWGEEATLVLAVPEGEVEALERALRDATGDRVRVEAQPETILVPIQG